METSNIHMEARLREKQPNNKIGGLMLLDGKPYYKATVTRQQDTGIRIDV